MKNNIIDSLLFPSLTTFAELNGTQVYFPFIPIDIWNSPNIIQLPESDDGTSDNITLPSVPFGVLTQTTAYVSEIYLYPRHSVNLF